MTSGERIKKYRKERRLSQMEVSKIAGIPQSTVSSVERGTRQLDNLTVDTFKRLAGALQVSLDVLAGYRQRTNGDDQTSHD